METKATIALALAASFAAVVAVAIAGSVHEDYGNQDESNSVPYWVVHDSGPGRIKAVEPFIEEYESENATLAVCGRETANISETRMLDGINAVTVRAEYSFAESGRDYEKWIVKYSFDVKTGEGYGMESLELGIGVAPYDFARIGPFETAIGNQSPHVVLDNKRLKISMDGEFLETSEFTVDGVTAAIYLHQGDKTVSSTLSFVCVSKDGSRVCSQTFGFDAMFGICPLP